MLPRAVHSMRRMGLAWGGHDPRSSHPAQAVLAAPVNASAFVDAGTAAGASTEHGLLLLFHPRAPRARKSLLVPRSRGNAGRRAL